MSALLLSVGACKGGNNSSTPSSSDEPGPQGPKELSIEEVFELEGSNFKYEGQEVFVKNTTVYAINQNMILCGYDGSTGHHPGTTSLKGFEVEVEQQPEWTTDHSTGGIYADVTPTGTLTNVNGRPVLKNATVEINNEVKLDDENNRLPEGSQMSCAYWADVDRETWNEYFGRNRSGVFVEAMVQLASVPEVISAEQGSSFYVVFPGENTNGADEENEYRIYVDLPAGMREKAINFYNGIFHNEDATKNWKVGDFFTLDAFTRYDSSKGGMTLFCDDKFGPAYDALTPDADKPEIITSWASIKAAYDPKYLTPLPAIGCEEEGVFSYTLNDYYGSNIDELLTDPSFVLTNHKNTGLIEVLFNCGQAKVEAVFAAIKTKVAAAGYILDTSVALDDDEVIYVLKDGETPVAEIYAVEETRDVKVMFMALRPSEAFNTFAEGLAGLNAKASAKSGETLNCSVPVLSAENNAKVVGTTLVWPEETDITGALRYSLEVEFAPNAFADDDAWEAFIEEQEAALVTAGFSAGYEIPEVMIVNGFYLASEFSFVEWELMEDADGEYCGAKLTVTFIGGVNSRVFDCAENSTWSEAKFLAYAEAKWTSITPFAFNKDDYAADKDLYLGAYNPGYEETLLGYVAAYCIPTCAAKYGQTSKTADANFPELFDYQDIYVLNSDQTGYVLVLYACTTPAAASGVFYLDVYYILTPAE